MKASGLFLGAVVYLTLTAGTGWAADDALPHVGRISAAAGLVQYQSTTGEWSTALINEPVAAGTGLRATQKAEAEFRSPGVRVALAPSSELHIVRLDGETLEISVASGRIGIHLDAAQTTKTVEIDLPSGGVWLSPTGDYDITAGDTHDPAVVQVFSGKAELGGGLDDRYIAVATRDSFSDWWRSQDDSVAAADHVSSPDIAGVTALDAAGRWETDSLFGKVWYPSDVAADWSPYRDGAWRFLPPWGWTWVDDAVWGFMPSHFGRWARIDDRWAWVPGAQLEPNDYSPAVVAFLGTAGIGLSRPGDAGPAVAWFPLAPGESVGDGDDANYKNRRFATAVPRTVFATGLPVAAALINDVPERRFVEAPVILQSLGIPPTSASVVAAAPKKPATVTVAAVSMRAPTPPRRHPIAVALRATPAHEAGKKLRIAVAIVLRPHALPSTSALRSLHTRAHLAAARGGA
jgi:hypothetical protein